MMKQFLLILIILSSFSLTQAQINLDYYLPKTLSYNPQTPKPKEVLGFEIGEWHLSHDQLLMYLKTLVANSQGRMKFETYGYTYENRPLLLLTITSPKNHEKIEQIRLQHLDLSKPQKANSLNTNEMPLVVWLGYSVHGNEPSGTNSSALVAYHLAAGQGAEIDKLLENTVILLDPCINPDGMQRFSSWVNMHKSKTLVTDPQSREFNEVSPRGRTNHYWFDLNRDWLPLQLPESKGRIQKFHQWKPNILTDHHEMGTNATFFFQPGVPSRQNPLTPSKNFDLTTEIGKFHAQALDSIHSLYYTKEGFDDFYYGKGSSYPDINGGVGILFEQASSRGHAQESANGILNFSFTIKNQFNASLSTLKAGLSLRKKMLDYQREFYTSVPIEKGGYVFGNEGDMMRNYHLNEMLLAHQIEVYQLNQDLNLNNQKFKKNKSYFVPFNQPQQRLIKAIFETQTKFQDSLFYDISTWTMPLAFDLNYAKTALNPDAQKMEKNELPLGKIIGKETQVGYAFKWENYYAPRALYRLLNRNVRAKVVSQKGTYMADNQALELSYGDIIVPLGTQNMAADRLLALMQEIAEKDGIDIYAIQTGFAEAGIDFGSNDMRALSKPSVLLVAGEGADVSEMGEAWHLLDQRYEIPASMMEAERLAGANLQRYNTIVIASGNHNLNAGATENIKNWLRQGNNLICIGSANNWLKTSQIAPDLLFKTKPKEDSLRYLSYGDKDQWRGAQELAGTIFEAQIDISHPLGYGYKTSKIPVFRSNTIFAQKSKNGFQTPIYHAKNPLLSGYVSKDNLKQLENSAYGLINFYGNGRVISLLDDPNFRAFWYGTNKIFANALFFGRLITR
jgi:hypothetical protein